ncbi:MAG: peroxiredoxin [Caulobacteraceae bacterium]|nr:peroxiredoxin [Caulobacteraceae bacterium]
MNRLFSAATFAVVAAVATAAMAAPLNVGAKAPDVQTKTFLDGKEADFKLADALKKGPVVLYFFPAAFTPGCTAEAHAFSDAYDDFKKAGASILGMTAGAAPITGSGMLSAADADFTKQLASFSQKECAGKFPVGGANPAVVTAYGVGGTRGTTTTRTSYVIAPDGSILESYTDNNFADHITKALAAVNAWKTAHPKG